MNTKKTSLASLKLNDNNPRIIKDYKFEKLVKSLLTFPEMLTLRPIVANRQMLVLGGNMRLRALLHISQMTEQELRHVLKKYQREDLTEWWLAWHDKPMVDYLSAEDLTDEQQKEFIIKDNVGYGEWEWDALANEWEMDALSDWGVDLPIDCNEEMEDNNDDKDMKRIGEVPFTEVLGESHNYVVLFFDNDVDWLQAQTLLEISPVKSLSTRKDGDINKGNLKIGVGRVINGAKAFNNILKNMKDYED